MCKLSLSDHSFLGSIHCLIYQLSRRPAEQVFIGYCRASHTHDSSKAPRSHPAWCTTYRPGKTSRDTNGHRMSRARTECPGRDSCCCIRLLRRNDQRCTRRDPNGKDRHRVSRKAYSSRHIPAGIAPRGKRRPDKLASGSSRIRTARIRRPRNAPRTSGPRARKWLRVAQRCKMAYWVRSPRFRFAGTPSNSNRLWSTRTTTPMLRLWRTRYKVSLLGHSFLWFNVAPGLAPRASSFQRLATRRDNAQPHASAQGARRCKPAKVVRVLVRVIAFGTFFTRVSICAVH